MCALLFALSRSLLALLSQINRKISDALALPSFIEKHSNIYNILLECTADPGRLTNIIENHSNISDC